MQLAADRQAAEAKLREVSIILTMILVLRGMLSKCNCGGWLRGEAAGGEERCNWCFVAAKQLELLLWTRL